MKLPPDPIMIQILIIREHCHGNGFNIANSILRSDYVILARENSCALFIYLIPEDVLSGNSMALGVTGAL